MQLEVNSLNPELAGARHVLELLRERPEGPGVPPPADWIVDSQRRALDHFIAEQVDDDADMD